MKEVHIEEVVTFIKATREEAVTLAYEIGGGEVHALYIQRGFESPAEKPVGYYVMPTKEWLGLTKNEQSFIYNNLHNSTTRIDSFWVDFANAIGQALKDKNT